MAGLYQRAMLIRGDMDACEHYMLTPTQPMVRMDTYEHVLLELPASLHSTLVQDRDQLGRGTLQVGLCLQGLAE